jgi:uracil-DNA glycosylase family 4
MSTVSRPSRPPYPVRVPAGSGWPDDPATADTPVAGDPADVAALAASATTLAELDARVSVCRACPRLVVWREQVAGIRRRAFSDEQYWGRPIAGWGATQPRLLVVGLAPAAHGGNRTGRIFTGDRSGDWLFASLHRVGLATQPESVRAGDGQRLLGTRMAAAVRCAPPDNRPTIAERDGCAPWLVRELTLLLPDLRVVVALGRFAWSATLRTLRAAGGAVPSPLPRFGHGARAVAHAPDGSALTLLGCYHPSQQNTFTGRVTEPMLDEVLRTARELAGLGGGPSHSDS